MMLAWLLPLVVLMIIWTLAQDPNKDCYPPDDHDGFYYDDLGPDGDEDN